MRLRLLEGHQTISEGADPDFYVRPSRPNELAACQAAV